MHSRSPWFVAIPTQGKCALTSMCKLLLLLFFFLCNSLHSHSVFISHLPGCFPENPVCQISHAIFKCGVTFQSPWYNRTGWLGVKHQVTYLCHFSGTSLHDAITSYSFARCQVIQVLRSDLTVSEASLHHHAALSVTLIWSVKWYRWWSSCTALRHDATWRERVHLSEASGDTGDGVHVPRYVISLRDMSGYT